MQPPNGKSVEVITALQIPVEIFIIFLVKNKRDFTVQDVIIEFQKMHKVELTYNRMKQILDVFVDGKKLSREIKPAGQKKKPTAFYTFNKLY